MGIRRIGTLRQVVLLIGLTAAASSAQSQEFDFTFNARLTQFSGVSTLPDGTICVQTGAFAGNKVVYLSAGDQSGANSNWQALATWNVAGASPVGPSVTGKSPAHTNSPGPALYTFTFSDPGGFADPNSVENIIVNSAIDGRHACFLAFVPATNSVLLVDDAGDAAGPYQGLVLRSNASIANSQCMINGTGSSVSRSGNALSLALSMSLNQSFAGNQVFFAAARNGSGNSNWQAVGSVSVP